MMPKLHNNLIFILRDTSKHIKNRTNIMTSTQQRAALQRQIWQIANDVRGSVDGWDFKQYVLGTLFYRFISENFASYIEGGRRKHPLRRA